MAYGAPHEQYFFVDNWEATLQADIGTGDTVLTIEGPLVDALATPTPASTRRYLATLDDGVNIELVEITGRNTTTDTVTVVRARWGTTAAAFLTGTKLQMRPAAGMASLLGAGWVDSNNNVVLGPNSAGADLTTGYSNVLLGNGAGYSITTGYESVGVGAGALGQETTGFRNTALGYNAMGGSGPNADHNVAVGYNAGQSVATGRRGTYVGAFADGGFNDVLCLGYGAVALAANQGVIGSNNAPITDIYIGEGVDTNSPPASVTLNATGGGGINVAGATLRIAGGKGTGTGVGGKVVIATAPPGSSGSSQNALVERAEWDATGLLWTYGGLKTADPGAGAGTWKLGTFQVGAVTLDTANYIEVDIGGTVRKLLVST